MIDRRCSLRLKTFCLVQYGSTHGSGYGVARNVSTGGVFLETRDPLPIGAEVRLWFTAPDGRTRLGARAEVKNHYFFHYGRDGRTQALVGMGARFVLVDDRLHDRGDPPDDHDPRVMH